MMQLKGYNNSMYVCVWAMLPDLNT